MHVYIPILYADVCMYTCLYMFLCIHAYVCAYIYMYVDIHVNIYIYIYGTPPSYLPFLGEVKEVFRV